MEFSSGRTGGPLDLDLADAALRLRSHEVDVQKPVVEPCALHLDALRQHEGALELPRGDAAMEVDALALLLLLAAHDELVVLDDETQVIEREARDREGQAQRILAGLLDVVRWIAVTLRLGDAIEHALEMIEAQKQRRIENG